MSGSWPGLKGLPRRTALHIHLSKTASSPGLSSAPDSRPVRAGSLIPSGLCLYVIPRTVGPSRLATSPSLVSPLVFTSLGGTTYPAWVNRSPHADTRLTGSPQSASRLLAGPFEIRRAEPEASLPSRLALRVLSRTSAMSPATHTYGTSEVCSLPLSSPLPDRGALTFRGQHARCLGSILAPGRERCRGADPLDALHCPKTPTLCQAVFRDFLGAPVCGGTGAGYPPTHNQCLKSPQGCQHLFSTIFTWLDRPPCGSHPPRFHCVHELAQGSILKSKSRGSDPGFKTTPALAQPPGSRPPGPLFPPRDPLAFRTASTKGARGSGRDTQWTCWTGSRPPLAPPHAGSPPEPMKTWARASRRASQSSKKTPLDTACAHMGYPKAPNHPRRNPTRVCPTEECGSREGPGAPEQNERKFRHECPR